MGRGRGSNQQLQQGGRSKKLKAPRIFPRGFWTLTFVVLRLVLMICKRTDYKLILGNGRRSKPFFVQQKRFISLPTLICLKFFYVSIQTGAVHRSEILFGKPSAPLGLWIRPRGRRGRPAPLNPQRDERPTVAES